MIEDNEPIDILAPNRMGDSLMNRGVDQITQNRGLGVAEAGLTRPQGLEESEKANPAAGAKNRLRVAKAREFGMAKEEVGF